MAVYVDDMQAPYGRMKMCHMLADTDEELHAMADTIGVARKWQQCPPKASGSHYDIALAKRTLAVQAGAIQISMRQASAMNARRRVMGELGTPEEAEAWLAKHRAARRLVRTDAPCSISSQSNSGLTDC